jgi:cytochrome P450
MDGPGTTERQRTDADSILASLATPEVSADPYPVYARLRELGPVRFGPAATTFVTGYDDCAAVARDPVFRAQSPEWNDRSAPGWRERPARIATFEAMLFRLITPGCAAWSPRRSPLARPSGCAVT